MNGTLKPGKVIKMVRNFISLNQQQRRVYKIRYILFSYRLE